MVSRIITAKEWNVLSWGFEQRVRAYDPGMRPEEAIKLFLVSFDSAIKSRLPIDRVTCEVNALTLGETDRVRADSPFWRDFERLRRGA